MTVDADGVAIITWDVPGKSMNVMSLEGFAELDALIDRALADDGREGHRHHLGQGQLRRRHGPERPGEDEGRGGRRSGARPLRRPDGGRTRILRKIERAGMDPKTLKGGKPIAAALPGTALGIGLRNPAGLSPHLRRRQPEGQDRPARDHGRHLPRRGRHHAACPQDGRDGRRAVPAGRQDAASPPKAKGAGLVDEVVPARRAAGARQGLGAGGDGRRHREALGPEGLQDAGRRALSPGGLHDLRRAPRHGQRQDARASTRRPRRCCRRSTKARWCPSTPR